MRYNPKEIESKWQKKWATDRIYEPALKKAKRPFYNLMMFPYPSAEGLHVGNMYAFAGSDIHGRFRRMQGYDVFEPIGLDGFGIHSENYALKIGKHPMKQAKVSESNFYRQLSQIGNGFAWREHLETYDPQYYKWTQWIFAEMFKRGLAYRKKAKVNWCPSCKTVLADEQVVQGKCERCASEVIKKDLEQWFFKITDYAERLLENLKTIDWTEKVKIAQAAWIGRSEGAEIKFPISNSQFSIDVFTTRPDTLFGATYMVLAPEHELVKSLKLKIENWGEVEEYVKVAAKKSEIERTAETKNKTGVELKGVKAINPATKEEIPIWVADYVLAGYGTGAIMAVPAHDERDFEFAKKFKLPVKIVIEPETGEVLPNEQFRKSIVAIVEDPETKKFLTLNWGPKLGGTLFIGGGREEGEDEVAAALREIREETGYANLVFVQKTEQMHHHYFAFSKGVARNIEVSGLHFRLAGGEKARKNLQHDEKGNFKIEWLTADEILRRMEDENHLLSFRRLILGEVYTGGGLLMASGRFNGTDSDKAKWEITKFVGGERKTQYRLRDWLISRQRYWGPPIPMIYCEKCGWQPVPEKDLPVKLPFVKNFRPTGTGQSPLASVKSFYETKCPKCKGKARRETDVSDTFLDSAWYFIGYLMTFGNWKLEIGNSAFSRLARKWLPVDMYIGGAEHSVLHLLYSRFLTMVFHDWGLLNFEEPYKKFRAHGLIIKDGAKMSKSKGNIVNPDDYIRAYGADALRLYLMFTGPFQDGGDFRDAGIAGMTRFLQRIWRFFEEKPKAKSQKPKLQFKIQDSKDEELQRAVHRTIKKVTEDIEALRYNTAISALMILLNEFEARTAEVSRQDQKIFLQLLAPLAPHITEELYQHFFRNQESGIRNSKQIQKLKSQKPKQFNSIHCSPWPAYDPKKIESEEIDLVVQINGRVRGRLRAPKGITEVEAATLARKDKTIAKYLAGAPKKIVFVPDRLISFVI